MAESTATDVTTAAGTKLDCLRTMIQFACEREGRVSGTTQRAGKQSLA
jgi:hypothetical protein